MVIRRRVKVRRRKKKMISGIELKPVGKKT